MSKLPAFQFYPGDWRKDPALQSLEYHDRGVWMELLCLMHESEERGVLVINGIAATDQQVARLLGLDNQICNQTITTLLNAGVAKRRQEDGALYSTRMVRDQHIRFVRTEAGKKGGNPNLLNQKSKDASNEIPTPSSSSSSSISSSDKEINTNTCSSLPSVAPNPLVELPVVTKKTSPPGLRPNTIAFGEFKHVLMTRAEAMKLVATYGRDVAKAKVESLDACLETQPAKYRAYKNHYATLSNWLRMEANPKVVKHEHLHKNETKTEQGARDLERERKLAREWAEQTEAEGT